MPRDDVEHGPAVVVPGAYRTLLEIDCQHATEPDPRLYLVSSETPEQGAEWEQVKADGRRKAALLLNELLAAGEPITVAQWKLSRNRILALRDLDVPLLRDRSITHFVVYADDRTAPADPPAVRWW
jgi:hypothetical protein